MQARDIMTESPVCCVPQETIRKVSQTMRDMDIGILPVCDNNQTLVGVITDRDIVCRVLAEGKDCSIATVQDGMTSGNLVTVLAEAAIDDVLDKMEEAQVRRLPVVDVGNHVIGIISTADIALELDEEGDIAEVFEEISEPTHKAA